MNKWVALPLVILLSLPVLASAEPEFLIRVGRQASNDLATLRMAGFPVVHETLGSLFLEGDAKHVEGLRDRGFAVTLLDQGPEGWDYVQVGLRPDSDLAVVQRTGTEVFAEENWRLFRLPRGTPLEALAEARVFLTRLPHEPAAPPDSRPIAAWPLSEGRLAADPLIQQMVNRVSAASINRYWNDIVKNPPTPYRWTLSVGCRNAATYCYNELQSVNVPPAYQNYNSGYAPNVIGTHAGAVTPGQVYIVIGHLDDMPWNQNAPGADDNASGSVTVLESARVMSCYGFKSTIKFITCTGEELGLVGSGAYAADAAARGEDIRGVINFDMNGWQGDGIPSPENLDLNYNDPSSDLAMLFAQCAADYNTGLVVDAFLCPSMSASDHYPFWQRGWKALCGITDNEGYCSHGGSYPYYHTKLDTIANCGAPSFFYSTIKATVATLATLAEPFKITFDNQAVPCDQPGRLLLADRDLNTNPATSQTVAVEVWSSSEPVPETIVLTEDGVDSMIFTGEVPTSSGPPVAGDGIVAVAGTDTITARYVDALDCDGGVSVTYTGNASADCAVVPGEVSALMTDQGVWTHVGWAAVPRADRYDVAGGMVSDLGADRDFSRAACLADDLPAVWWDDTRQDPSPGNGYYYIVRGENAYGSGSYGSGRGGAQRLVTACP